MSMGPSRKVRLTVHLTSVPVAQSVVDVVRAMEIAFNYRNFFRKDIIIDLMCYRQWLVAFESLKTRT